MLRISLDIDECFTVYGSGSNTSGKYASIALIYIFQGFYSFGVSPMIALYPQEISYYKIRAAGAAICRGVSVTFSLIFSFAMSYAMENLGWKFYMINGSWDIIFVLIIYIAWVETKGLGLEEITAKFEGRTILEGSELKRNQGAADSPEFGTIEEKIHTKVQAGAL